MAASLIIALSVLGYCLYNFLTQWQYSEAGHEYFLIASVVLSIFVFFALRISRIGLAVFLVICIAAVNFYANKKFEWRENYIENAKSGQYFAFEDYIETYPTFEETKFSWATNTPKWVAFSEECYQPLLNGTAQNGKNPIGRNCKSSALIFDFYGIDIRGLINNHYRKMQYTATQLEKGRLARKINFEQCIQNKQCAMIPLLPASAENITQQSDEYLDIRRQFWSLINDKKMSPENCGFFDLCRTMVQAEIITLDQL